MAIVVLSWSPVLAREPVPVQEVSESVAIGDHLGYLEDPGAKLTFDQARQGAYLPAPDEPSFGFTDSVYWFHLALHNSADTVAERLLEIGYPPLDQLTLYVEGADGNFDELHSGDEHPFAHRPIEHHNFVFPIAVSPSSTIDVYIRVESSSSMQVPIKLQTARAFATASARTSLFMGIFYGVVMVMTLYNLFLFIGLRDRSYLYFCIFVAGYCVVQAGIDGFAYQYAWPNSPAWNRLSLPLSVAVTSLGGMLFARSFLDLRATLPRADQLLRALLWVIGATILVSLAVPYADSIRLVAVEAAVFSILLLVIGTISLRAGNRAARFFVLGWLAFLLGAVLLVLSKFGVLPVSVPTVHGPRIGAVLDMLFLSFALADRINFMKAETETAQRSALEAQTLATHRLEEEVAKQTRELRELDAQKTRFFQNVSHELRTPLTLILAPLEQLAADPKLQGDTRLKLSLDNAGRLLRLVNQLLDFQKLEAGKREFQLANVELGGFVRAMSEHARPACEGRDIHFELESPDRPVVIRAEADALEKILFNYLSNALKYTPDGGSIRVTVAIDDQDAVVTVADTGPGIALEAQGRLFQVFSQVDDGAHGGTGLGLALVKELAEGMDGEVGLDSQPGAGSRFFVRFPLAADQSAQLDGVPAVMHERLAASTGAHRTVQDAEPAAQLAATGADVLIVDDLADMRALIRRILVDQGYRVLEAASGAEALELARHHRPRLVLSDWMMPRMSGPELIRELRADEELTSTPVVLLTAKSDEKSRLEGTSAGADAFLGKPFHAGELLSVVRNLLALKAREREVEQLNDELRDEGERLREAQDRRAQLSQFIVHDLKNPLTIITASIGLLLDEDSLPADVHETLEGALLASETANRMVMDLLDVDRNDDGALTPELRSIEAPALLEEVGRRMGRWLRLGGSRLEIDAEPVALTGDHDLVLRTLENLVENAAKYGARDGTVRMSATLEEDAVVLRVIDDGPGIPAEQHDRVFDKYHRLDQRDDAVRSSRGLGLVFCRVATEAQGGAIWLEDAKPSGCCFCIRLPVADASSRRAATSG
jgi:two-component system, sensor histidine kinase LadS